jgi:dienelactone hydrolase
MNKITMLLVLVTCLMGSLMASGAGQKATPALSVTPAKALIDEVVSISITGLAQGQAATVKATMTDNHGMIWRSEAEFVADRKGLVDLSKHSPARGSYTGVDPMGLFWSMNAQPGQPESHAQAQTFLAPVTMKFDLEIDGKTVNSATLTRLFVAPGVKSSDVRDAGLVARFYEPEKGGPHAGILVIGGSEGGIRSAEANAALLASRGYAALAVAYFGMEGLPQRLVGVPIDYLKKAIDWMGARETIDRRRLAVFGGSKGGELALLLASRFPELKTVVAYVPSHVVWQSIGGAGSSWNYQGQPVPYVPYKGMPSTRGANQPLTLMPLYLGSLEDKEAVAKASIPVEKINGPVLVISGKDDQLWPSSLMADQVIARLKENRHPYKFEHLAYESAGHSIRTSYGPTTRSMGSAQLNLGGNPAANARAQADSWPKTLAFLKDGLKKAGER